MSHETKDKNGVKEDERDGREEREYEKKDKPFEWSWGKGGVLKGVEGKKDEERSIERSGGKEDEGIEEERRRVYYYMKVETIL